jgi:hypothetical protein
MGAFEESLKKRDELYQSLSTSGLRIRKPAGRCAEAQSSSPTKADCARNRCSSAVARGAAKPQMTAYVDSTMLLKLALGQPNSLAQWLLQQICTEQTCMH